MYFPDPVIFELPVLPRVEKFIHAKLTGADGRTQPMLVHPQAYGPGLFLWAMAQSEKIHLFSNYQSRPGLRDASNPARRRMHPVELSSVIGIGIQEFHYTRAQYLLNYAELSVFSNMVDHMILNELVLFCEREPDTPPMSRIKRFCDHYDFSEDEFNEVSLKQMFLRYRKGTGAFNFAREISQHFDFVPMAA